MNTIKIYLKLLTVIAVFSIFGVNNLSGQVIDTSFSGQFNAFKQQITQEYSGFTSHNDSLFRQFLKNSWAEFEGKENPIPVSPKPWHQPEVTAPENPGTPADSTHEEMLHDTASSPGNNNTIPETDAFGSVPAHKVFSYFGTPVIVPVYASPLPLLGSVSKQGISDYYTKISRSEYYDNLIHSISEKAENCQLNDWGFASMLYQASKLYYATTNEQVLFTWAGLLRSGYNVKVGFSSYRVYLLIPSDVALYTVSYTVADQEYYVLKPEIKPANHEKIFIHEGNYPGNKAQLSFKFTSLPRLQYQAVSRDIAYLKPLKLQLNKNLLDFYTDYPACDLAVYFNTPLSSEAEHALDNLLLSLLKGMNDSRKTAFLLDYVQHAIQYKTDREQFGRERYLFADETLYYQGADCEDRSVLFARLLNRYTTLDVVGLCYPTHVTVAVKLPDCIGDDYVVFKGAKFYQCDPTYLNASCGMGMPEIKGKNPGIINFMNL